MLNYLIMKEMGHNLVYYNESMKLSISELKIANKKLDNVFYDISIMNISGIDYISFSKETQLNENEIRILSNLSFTYAIFELKTIEKNIHLIPIDKEKKGFIDPKISSMLKYKGKTNPTFTKMMINVGLLASGFDYSNKIRLLDPVAGRGTTLYEGIVNGFDVFGIEIDKKSVHEASVFFKKYLEAEKYKHTLNKGKITGVNKKDISTFSEFRYTINKDDFKDKSLHKKLKLVCGNSINAASYFPKKTFHLIIGDLPYGISHGNVAKTKSSSKTRTPFKFLKESLAQWKKVLKDNGVIVLAWNKFVFSRKDFVSIFEENGFEVFNNEDYNNFEHKVDSSIKRDIIVAKPIK